MKKLLPLFAMLTLFVSMMAQTPFNYQAVLRNPTTKELVRNQNGTAHIFVKVVDDARINLYNGNCVTNSDGMLNLQLTPESEINWAFVDSIYAEFTMGSTLIKITTPVTPVPYAYHADNAILTTESIENYLASGVDGNHAALLHAALKSNSEFHDACRDTVVEYIKANYPKAKEIAYDYLRQVTSTDVNQFYNEARGLSQEVKDSLYSVAKRFLKDNRDLVKEMALYYAGSATSAEVQQLYNELQANATASAKVRSLLNGYFDAYLIRMGLYCDHATLCEIINELDDNPVPPTPTTFTCGTDKMEDAEHHKYETLQFGNQCWTKTNMRTKTAAVATATLVAGGTNVSSTAPYYYIPTYSTWQSGNLSYDQYNDSIFGYYYNFAAANVICPEGWHLPTILDWTYLLAYVDNAKNADDEYLYRCERSGNVAKALASESGWANSSNSSCYPGYSSNPNNATGFSAFPAGHYYPQNPGGVMYAGASTYLWSSAEVDGDKAAYYRIDYYNTEVFREDYGRGCGMSVRCVRDVASSGGETSECPTPTSTPTNNVYPFTVNLVDGYFTANIPFTDGDQPVVSGTYQIYDSYGILSQSGDLTNTQLKIQDQSIKLNYQNPGFEFNMQISFEITLSDNSVSGCSKTLSGSYTMGQLGCVSLGDVRIQRNDRTNSLNVSLPLSFYNPGTCDNSLSVCNVYSSNNTSNPIQVISSGTIISGLNNTRTLHWSIPLSASYLNGVTSIIVEPVANVKCVTDPSSVSLSKRSTAYTLPTPPSTTCPTGIGTPGELYSGLYYADISGDVTNATNPQFEYSINNGDTQTISGSNISISGNRMECERPIQIPYGTRTITVTPKVTCSVNGSNTTITGPTQTFYYNQ